MNASSIGVARPQRTRKEIFTHLTTVSMSQIAQLSGVAAEDLEGLVEYGVLQPVGTATPPVFRLECIIALQRANALREDLALDGHSFALALMFMGQVAELEAQVRDARAELLMLTPHNMIKHDDFPRMTCFCGATVNRP